MRWRVFALMVVLGLLGWWGLVVIQRQFGIGEFAQSPQQFNLMPGRKIIVAGGRGLLAFIDQGRRQVVIEARCAAGRRLTKLREGDVSEEACGFTVRWLGPSTRPGLAPGSQLFEVSWRSEEDAGGPVGDPGGGS